MPLTRIHLRALIQFVAPALLVALAIGCGEDKAQDDPDNAQADAVSATDTSEKAGDSASGDGGAANKADVTVSWSDGSAGSVDAGGPAIDIGEPAGCVKAKQGLRSLTYLNGAFVVKGRTGARAVAAGSSVAIVAGAELKKGASKPLSEASFTKGYGRVDVPGLDACTVVSTPPWSFVAIGEGRFRPAVAATKGGDELVVAGGFMDIGGSLLPTPTMTLVNIKTGKSGAVGGTSPHMQAPRSGHTITRLPALKDTFFIAGGADAAGKTLDTWELWSPAAGVIKSGKLSRKRKHHAAVVLPGSAVAHILVLGGEDDTAALADYEVIRYDSFANVASKASTKITCSVGAKYYGGPGSEKTCEAAKGQPGTKLYTFTPIPGDLADKVPRTMAGVVFTKLGTHHHLHVVGGFEDRDHSKPSKRIDALNTASAAWIKTGIELKHARGAPMIAATKDTSGTPVVFVTGGLDASGKSVGEPFAIRYPGNYAGGGLKRVPIADPTGVGNRFDGFIAATGGAVVLGGGVRSDAKGGWKDAPELAAWRP